MPVLLAALGFFLSPPVVFGQGLFADRPWQTAAAAEGMWPVPVDRTGREGGSLGNPQAFAQAIPVQGIEGLPEGFPWEEKPAGDEEKQAPAEEGEAPTAPPEEGQ
ncbi:hypothetical protein [Methylacidimicrobium sp. AP8]|uniref:hypothetical protein n=1 Tax=Methylacidimicrobium sp. AP8 TaxID=2730359 RepID=UPI001924B339|nr:hypothetical protein [Methylacidimicrobium sp. AP8]